MKKSFAARRLQKLQESVIRSITRYALEKGAVLLAQGFPDFDPPQEVLAAAEQAMGGGKNQLGRGLVRFAFPKKDETLDEVERRFAKLK